MTVTDILEYPGATDTCVAGKDDSGFAVVGQLLTWLADNYRDQPSLEDIAKEAGLSPFHLQRLFTRYVGVSPKKYVQYLTLGHAKQALAASSSVLDAAFDAGLSEPGACMIYSSATRRCPPASGRPAARGWRCATAGTTARSAIA